MGGIATKLIEKNTTIPASKSQIFSTASDNQTQVEINIVQGERAMATDNKSLGRFVLDGIPPSPRGIPQIEVTFDIDANGILNVKAMDKASNKVQSIRIEASSGLSEADIEKMKQDSEKYAEEDKKKRETVDAKNLAEQTIYTAEKAMKDAGDKITDEIKKPIDEKIKELRDAMSKDDLNLIQTKTGGLSTEMQKIGEFLNKNQQTAGADNSGNTEKAGEEKVRDAEVEDDKKENK
jgi:molecular chaperone DnaK